MKCCKLRVPFSAIINHFYTKNNGGADGCDDVGDDEWPIANEHALNHEEYTPGAHGKECG
jgi:hypothetical protein